MHASAVEQAGRVRSGEISAVELVEASLAAIERLNPELNAFVALCPERALEEAAAIAPGDPRPLCGVPIGIKDLLSATEGLPTTHGSNAFGDWYADHDSAHVRRLREAGAIVVGKTNTPELGLRPVTENARFGATRNPHDPSLSPGGSSGGSAAAVASGMVPLADGSDFGGSIRIPAACCGLVGLKPSRGRVSIGPDFGLVGAGMPADGVLASTVRDAVAGLEVIAGYEPGDHHFLPLAPPRDPGRVRVRLALRAPFGVPVDPEPRAAAERAAVALEAAGHEIVEGEPDWDDDTFPAAWAAFATGAMQHIVRVLERLHGRPLDPDGLEPATRGWLLGTPEVGLVDHLEASERLWGYARRLLRGWGADEVLLTPAITRLPVPVGGMRSQAGVTDDAVRFSVLVRIFNVTGQPAASVPFGDAGGIPLGVQLAGPPGRDDLVLALAAQLEAAQPPRSAAMRS